MGLEIISIHFLIVEQNICYNERNYIWNSLIRAFTLFQVHKPITNTRERSLAIQSLKIYYIKLFLMKKIIFAFVFEN